jgi:phosphoserine aminotransferase
MVKSLNTKMRTYNFGAGPAMLPEPILLEAQAELLNWHGLGVSVMEIGHRTAEFRQLMEQIEADLRELISIPNNYHVLFLGGAARTQFGMIPMNLLHHGQQAGYLVSGLWSSQAFDEACKLKQAYCVASSEHTGFTDVPLRASWVLQKDTAYLYYTPNETVNGVRFSETPKVSGIPLVADMTSCLLSEPVNVADFGLIFAGAQKNIAIAGLTIVIIRDDLLDKSIESPIATMLDYKTHSSNKSLYATPPTFNCYLAGKMFSWIKAQGGVDALYQINCKKAAKLYQYIDSSSFYQCRVQEHARSLMNVCFSLSKPELESEFLLRANQRGLYALQGHRSVGGLRASLYNAMPMAGVESLLAFMRDFSEEYH